MDASRRGHGFRWAAALLAAAVLPGGGPAGGAPPAEEPAADPAPAPAILVAGRFGDHERALRDAGYSRSEARKVEEAVRAALGWLRAHQEEDGFWDSDGFGKRCEPRPCEGSGGPLYDVGVTSLALLAFLGHGDLEGDGPDALAARRAVRFLAGAQDGEGCYGPRVSQHFIYQHAIATLAMVEAAAMGGDAGVRESALRGIGFIQAAQNPGLGWRYGVRPRENDTSVTSWMMSALGTADWVGLPVKAESLEGGLAWANRVTLPDGRAGYTRPGNGPARPQDLLDRYPPGRSEALTAAGLTIRLFAGEDASAPPVAKGVERIAALPPLWSLKEGTVDLYYWYHGTTVLSLLRGAAWEKWRPALATALLEHQNRDEGLHGFGSWEPEDPWRNDGGRVYTTALGALMLEAPYRHAPVGGTTLSVDTRPPGARVYAGNRFLGITPLVKRPMVPRRVDLEFEHRAAGDARRTVVLAPGADTNAGTVDLPGGATVDMGGLEGNPVALVSGATFRGTFDVRAGPVRIVLERFRHWPVVLERTLAAGETFVPDAPAWEECTATWNQAVLSRLPPPPRPRLEGVALPAGMVRKGDRLYWEKDRAEMVLVPAPAGDPGPAFLVDRHEVTVEQYRRFCKETGSPFPAAVGRARDRDPMTHVGLIRALEYARWAGKRIPTPEEWSLAAYGRRETPWRDPRPVHPWGPWDTAEARNLPGREDGSERLASADSHPTGASAQGGLHLEGNVREWATVIRTLHDGSRSSRHELLGGSWKTAEFREVRPEDGDLGGDDDIGFRCVADLK